MPHANGNAGVSRFRQIDKIRHIILNAGADAVVVLLFKSECGRKLTMIYSRSEFDNE